MNSEWQHLNGVAWLKRDNSRLPRRGNQTMFAISRLLERLAKPSAVMVESASLESRIARCQRMLQEFIVSIDAVSRHLRLGDLIEEFL